MLAHTFILFLFAGLSQSDSPWHNSNCAGNRRAIVHLFEWKWSDVANECETFLGPRGYCGVQVSPPQEHAIIGVDANGNPDGSGEPQRPWWERYQPVSYILTSRSGSEEEFASMVARCNAVDVRIYVDAIINHMTGMGRSGQGTAGSNFDADAGDFPGVPFQMSNFNGCGTCPECCCIQNYGDHPQVRDCRLVGLIDLAQSLGDTQDKIAAYMNKCIGMGVAGFRVDAAKHMWPGDMEAIWGKLNDLDTTYFPAGSKPFIVSEVIDQNSNGEITIHEYTHLGLVTEFRFCSKVGSAAGSLWEIPGIYDPGWGMADPGDAFVFVDNHDNQRGHGGGGNTVTHKDEYKYKVAQSISLGWNYGYPRVMSSYYFENSELGPPNMGAPDYSTKDVDCNSGEWVCEHRWPVIAGMAGFAKATNGESAEDFWVEGNKAAWRRGDKGFVMISNDGPFTSSFYTGLPAGEYCNVIQGCATSSGCEGDTVSVGGDGMASISLTDGNNPVVAIHVEALSGSGQCVDGGGSSPTVTPAPSTSEGTATDGPTTSPGPTTTRPPGEYGSTVIYFFMDTQPGQDGFLRGGINHDYREGCTEDASVSPCAIDVTHISMGTGQHYEGYNAWRNGDAKLDWYGAEVGQGAFLGAPAAGTPMAWTTDDDSHAGYQPDNTFGAGYWRVELDMDCSQAYDEEGWFEFKGYISNWGWESDITQDAQCTGSVGGAKPYSSPNHFARCGYMNVFRFNDGGCQIDSI